MGTPNSASEQETHNVSSQSSASAKAVNSSTAATLAAPGLSVSVSTEAATKTNQEYQEKRSLSQPPNSTKDESFKDNASSTATAVNSKSLSRPCITRCSLNPSSWSKKRVRIASCGCFSSILVCTIRLLLDPGPSAYIIHSIIILFDLLLIHIFTYTLWLSIAAELTAIIFAVAFHLTNEKIFELIETTWIAVLVSFHMIRSRNEHWNREEDLERDMIGLQFYIEHYVNDGSNGHGNTASANNESGEQHMHRRSSLTKSEYDTTTNTENKDTQYRDVETGAFVPQSDMTSLSSFTTTRSLTNRRVRDGAPNNNYSWWNHFFDHFLDGSAGVMYTSFVGLIIDEIVNFGSSGSSAKY